MRRPIPFQHSPQAARARLTKAVLLPIPRRYSDVLSLTAYTALDALRAGRGWSEGAQHLIEVVFLAHFLSDEGYGALGPGALSAGTTAMTAVIEKGRATGAWELDSFGYEWIAAIIVLHDWQLRTASLSALSAASERLERIQANRHR